MNKNTIETESDISIQDLIIKIGQFWKILISKWFILLIVGAIGGVLGVFYAIQKQTVYTAETTFVLEEDNGSGSGMLGQLGGLAGIAGVDIGGAGGLFQGENIIQLYKSRSMVEKSLLTPVSQTNELMIHRYLDVYKLNRKWKDHPGLKSIDFIKDTLKRERDSIMLRVIGLINKDQLVVTKPEKKLSIISVKFTSADEILSKEFTENLVNNVNIFYIDTKVKKSKQNVAILQRQTDSVRAVMNGAIFASATTMDATPNLNPVKQILRAPAQRSQFNAEINMTMLGELVKNLELSKMALRRETPLIQVIDYPIYPLLKSQTSKVLSAAIGAMLLVALTSLFLIIKINFKQSNNDVE